MKLKVTKNYWTLLQKFLTANQWCFIEKTNIRSHWVEVRLSDKGKRKIEQLASFLVKNSQGQIQGIIDETLTPKEREQTKNLLDFFRKNLSKSRSNRE